MHTIVIVLKKISRHNSSRAFLSTLSFFILLCTLAACSSVRQGSSDINEWVGTWATAPQLVEPHNMPPEPGLTGNTLRQVVRVSLGGTELRARFSNEFGSDPLTLNAVHIAASLGASVIDVNTDTRLTFDGKSSVTIAPGSAVISDPFYFALKPRSEVAFTIHFDDVSPTLTGHPGSRTTSYLQPGSAVSAAELPDAITTDHWYVISGIDVDSPKSAAVVTLGDSITDGRGSGTNKQNRWPDELARRLQAADINNVGVLNMGIGGNCVLRMCLGPAALERFERDVLNQSGVRWLVILEGVNDIGQVNGTDEATRVAEDLIVAYDQMIGQAHAKGIRVYGATILPFGDSFYDAPERAIARNTVNEWIRTSGRFDAVIDLDAALRDPTMPNRLIPVADSGDFLHPNEEGHRMIAEAIDLTLFLK
jgi:lysophospholipase L1-like esterase